MTTLVERRVDVRAQRLRLRRRAILVTGALAAVMGALFVVTMMVGSFGLTATEVIGSILRLRDDPAVDFIVLDLRLPTAAAALAVGVALGIAGLVFQRLLANPLASPDFVGVSAGASLFAVSAIVLLDLGSTGISAAAVLGALVAAVLVYALAWRDGISGYRFILIGIGIAEVMLSLVGYVVSRAEQFEARQAVTWLIGAVGQSGPGELRLLLLALAVLVPVAVLLERALRTLELGDDAAAALGARVERTRLALLGLAIVLVALATAVAGPILFVALMAGPIATRLLGPASGGGLLAAGCVGAGIVLASELVAQHLLPVALPTGVVTGAIGAPYLLWLLASANREGRGG
jgi:iron complex transport system permease protein